MKMEEKKKIIEVSKEVQDEIRNHGGRMYDLTINIEKKEIDNPYKEVTII